MATLLSIASVRSSHPIPLRPAPAWQKKRDTLSGRIPLSDVVPAAPGFYRPKGYVGEVIPFGATAFREGHDLIGVQVRLTAPSGEQSLHRLQNTGTGLDRWQVLLAPLEQGEWTYQFESFADDFATWQHAAHLKLAVDVDVAVMREAGALVLERAIASGKHPAEDKKLLKAAITTLRDATADTAAALAVVDDPALTTLLHARPVMSLITVDAPRRLLVERQRAGVGSWYEFFPRSEGATRRADGTIASGTFATAQKRLPQVAGMGFDVVYLPPIHPIGAINRKGPNNTLTTVEGDPGSPWAIGSAAGGHDAVHPDLGTMADFRAFVAAAKEEGIEIALDLALQAAPDHPWVKAHPEWFTTLPDGTIAYAENPPKKYQDIYPINFDNDPAGIRAEVLRVVKHWIAQGVTIFRVDNPHTKPLQFWEWLIAEVLRENPDIVFLAEAFTRPAPLQALAAAGFQQSYTYFTWRNTKAELEEFLTGLATETADFLRPNLFVNTPDILTEYLQFGGRAAFAIRAIIAATAAPTWGVYAGYELFESVARPGAEENIDSEKYEYKLRDFVAAEAAGESLAPLLRTLNAIRDVHPALEQLRSFTVHESEDDSILVYSKHVDAALSPSGRDDTIIVVVNVDPHSVRETMVHLDTTVFGIPLGEQFPVVDVLTGSEWTWSDHNYVRLDAFTQPAHVLWVKR